MANEGSTKPTYSELETALEYERHVKENYRERMRASIERFEKAESALARVRGLLQQDAAGRPVSELLQLAANYMNENGGGPLADCLQLKAQEIESAFAESADIGKLDAADKSDSCNYSRFSEETGAMCSRGVRGCTGNHKSGMEMGKVNRVDEKVEIYKAALDKACWDLANEGEQNPVDVWRKMRDGYLAAAAKAAYDPDNIMAEAGSAETGGEKADCEHENAFVRHGSNYYRCPDCETRIPVALPACTATVHTADCDKTGECDRLDDYVTGVKEAPPNFPRTPQNQTVSGGVEGAHEGITADKSVAETSCPTCWARKRDDRNQGGMSPNTCRDIWHDVALAESSLSSPPPKEKP